MRSKKKKREKLWSVGPKIILMEFSTSLDEIIRIFATCFNHIQLNAEKLTRKNVHGPVKEQIMPQKQTSPALMDSISC